MTNHRKEDDPPTPEGNDDSGGYRKPPKATRFKKGQSGNGKGRPKGAKGHKAIVQEIANELHDVGIEGLPSRLSTLELVLVTLRNRAMASDLTASRFVDDVLSRYGNREIDKQGGYMISPEAIPVKDWIAREEAKNARVDREMTAYGTADYSEYLRLKEEDEKKKAG